MPPPCLVLSRLTMEKLSNGHDRRCLSEARLTEARFTEASSGISCAWFRALVRRNSLGILCVQFSSVSASALELQFNNKPTHATSQYGYYVNCLYFQVAHTYHKYEHRREKIPEGRRIYCKVPGCEFFTANKYHFAYHRKTHKSEKDIFCPVPGCDYSTIVESSLTSHMASHSDERPYKCEHCRFASKFRTILNQHMRKTHGIHVKSNTGNRGWARSRQQDTVVDTVERNVANDGVQLNSSHAPFGQPYPSPQHSSPSTSSSALSSPVQPRSFPSFPCSPISGIRAPPPAHSNQTRPPPLPFFQFPPIPSLLTSQPMLLNPAALSPEFLLSFQSRFSLSTPPPAHTKPADPPFCINSTLPAPPPAHRNPIPKHPGLDLSLFPLPFPQTNF